MHYRHSKTILFVLALAVGITSLFWPAAVMRSDSFIFYVFDQHHVVSSQTIGGVTYLPVLRVLDVGRKVTRSQEKRNTIRIWFDDTRLELHADKNTVKLDKTDLALSNP